MSPDLNDRTPAESAMLQMARGHQNAFLKMVAANAAAGHPELGPQNALCALLAVWLQEAIESHGPVWAVSVIHAAVGGTEGMRLGLPLEDAFANPGAVLQ